MFVTNSSDLHAMEKCRLQAQANANRTYVPWMVFQDTLGNYHVEKYTLTHQGVLEVCWPPTPKRMYV